MPIHSTAQSILVGSIVANLVVSNTVVRVLGLKSRSLSEYYAQLKMIAVCLDITSVTWGVLLAQQILSTWPSAGAALCAARHAETYKVVAVSIAVQVIHDVVFGMWIQRSTSQRPTMKLFQSYSNEHGAWILLIDALIMTTTVFVSRVVKDMSTSGLALTLSFTLYIHLLFLDGL